jgi:dihydrodipicolinate synthase/N-acetylneuraminate lyase
MKLSGVIVPHVTPLTRDERLDAAGLERLLEFLLRAGVHGIFSNGSMGGFAFYPDPMQLETIARTVEIVGGRVPVLAGVADTSTTRVLARVREAATLGADALVVLPPFYYLCRQDEIERFFRAVADESPLPIVLYDNPKLAKNAISPDTLAALAAHPNIIGAKVSATDVFKWQTIFRLDLPRERFALICGVEPMMGLGLQLGFDGVTGGVHNLVPGLAVALFDAVKAGRAEEAELIQQKLNRVYRVFEIDGGWRGAELTLAALGICQKVTAAPHDLPIPAEKRHAILEVLTREGVLSPAQAL